MTDPYQLRTDGGGFWRGDTGMPGYDSKGEPDWKAECVRLRQQLADEAYEHEQLKAEYQRQTRALDDARAHIARLEKQKRQAVNVPEVE